MASWSRNNELCWPTFLYSNTSPQLQMAAQIMKQVVEQEPDFTPAVDTYANLLYKLDQRDEAIRWQKKAVEQSPDDEAMKAALEDMKKGRPTYLDQGAKWTR